MYLVNFISAKFGNLKIGGMGILSMFSAITQYLKKLGLIAIISLFYFNIGSAMAAEKTVGDNFPTVSYSENSGSENWSGNWVEVGESDGASAGIARVRSDLCSGSGGNCLRLGVPSGSARETYVNKGVYRELDLTGATSATLSFVYRRAHSRGNQTVVLSVYDGTNWIDLDSYRINTHNTSPISASFDISDYAASNTQIRFLATGNNAIIGMYIDDIEIKYEVPTKLSVTANNISQEYEVSSYGGSSQDRTGTVDIRDAGLSLFLEGNRWQKIDFPYTVTENTVIEFDFQSTVQGEVQGLGFDNDLSISSDRSFKVYGTQNWGLSDFATYSGSGVTHFTIPVGEFYTGDFQYLFFMNDDDSVPTSNSLYSNIVVHEGLEPIVEYRFDETNWSGTSEDVLDSSDNALHGKAINVQPASGMLCNAADFNRTNRIEVANNALLDVGDNNGNYTVNFWLNPRSIISGWSNIIHKGSIDFERTFAAWFLSGGSSKVYHRVSTTSSRDEGHTSNTALGLNSWTMVTLVKKDNQLMTYFNGTLAKQTSLAGSSISNNGPLYIGDDPWYSGIDALMDELTIFGSALSATEIQNIRTNNLAGNGWDGSERNCPNVVVTPIIEYRFDEFSWNGTADEVIDSSGNDNNGVSVGGITTAAGKICNAASIPSNTSATTVEAVDSGVDLDTIIGSSGTISLWYKGNSAWDAASDKRLFDATDGDKYFVAEISNGKVKFWFEDGSDGDYQKSTVSTFIVGAGVWKHLAFAWDISTGVAKIFVDGIEQTVSGGNGSNVDLAGYNTLYFGDNRNSSYFTGESSADGLIDEALVFKSVLTASQIENIFLNQDAGNNYDGSERNCPVPLEPLLEYRFEEDEWDGSADEIIDSSGNNYHGQIVTNSTLVNPPTEDSPAALTGDPGTCGYVSQNRGSIKATGLDLPLGIGLDTTTGAKTTVTFWMKWDGTNSVMPIGWYVHDIWITSGNIGFNTGNGDLYGTSSVGLDVGWHHIAVEFTNGSVTNNQIHIDGEAKALSHRHSSRRPSTSRAVVDSELRIGGWSINTGYNFSGLLDEVRVYKGSLTTEQVVTIMNERHDCNSPTIHHYEISHDGQGLTCEAEPLTLKACTDESCSNVSAESVTLDILADGNVISSPTFTGSTTVNFNHTAPEILTFSVANATTTASDAVVCDNGTGTSCDMEFAEAGFRFLSGDGNSITIGNHTSGAVFNESLKLQAVKDVGGVCAALFSGNKNIDLSQENVAPGGTTGLSFTVNGAGIAKQGGVPSSTSTTLTFGTDSIATIPVPVYHDAGQIRLHANYSVGGVTLSGSSNAFWVSPDKLVVSAKTGSTNLNAASATATPIHSAGENFELTVSAYNAATPAAITPNYSPGEIEFKLARTGPTTHGENGTLTYGSNGSIDSQHSSTMPVTFQSVILDSTSTLGVFGSSTARYSEVGLLNLDVRDYNYANENIIISSAEAINIGRFTPDYFTQTVVAHGSFLATCNTGTAFVYSGQKDEATNTIGAISYLTNPVIAITAYNKQGSITKNYYEDSEGGSNDYMKLNASDITLTTPTLDQLAVGVDGNLLPLTANMSTGVLSQGDLTTSAPEDNPLPKGILHYQFSDTDNFFYNRSANTIVTPFTADIDFTITDINDEDRIDLTPTGGTSSTVDVSPTGVKIRFGRLVLNNSFGPETSDLPQPLQVEHYDGTNFIVTSNNDCTGYDAAKLSLTDKGLDPALTDKLGGIGSFIEGKTQSIELEAPGAGNQGELDVTYDTFNWLKFDWDNDGSHDDNPSAVATFGQFRGNDRIIYIREVSN